MQDKYSPQEIRREIRWLAVPIVLESIFSLSGNILSLALLGRIDGVGLNAITHVAANGMGAIINGVFWWLLKGLGIGATIRVSQAYGAGDQEKIRRLGYQTILLLFSLGLACGLIMFFSADFLVSLFKPDPALGRLAANYLRIAAAGLAFQGIIHGSTGVLQGIGDTKTPMTFSFVINLVFVASAAPLIFGWFGQPLGITGSAFGLLIGQFVTAMFCLYSLFSKGKVLAYKKKIDRHYFKPDPQLMWDVVSVGLPTSLENVFWQLGAIIIGGLMLSFGELAYAANQIGIQAESIANMPAASFGIVTVTLCGRALGAQDNKLGQRYITEIIKTAGAIVALGMVLLLVFPKPLLSLLSGHADVIDLASVYLRLMGIVLPFNTLHQIYLGCLKSTGMARLPMLTSLGGIWLIRVPLSLWVASWDHAKIEYLWLVILVDIFARFVLVTFIYHKRKVFHDPQEEAALASAGGSSVPSAAAISLPAAETGSPVDGPASPSSASSASSASSVHSASGPTSADSADSTPQSSTSGIPSGAESGSESGAESGAGCELASDPTPTLSPEEAAAEEAQAAAEIEALYAQYRVDPEDTKKK